MKKLTAEGCVYGIYFEYETFMETRLLRMFVDSREGAQNWIDEQPKNSDEHYYIVEHRVHHVK